METDKDGVDWDTLIDDAEEWDRENKEKIDEIWTEGALRGLEEAEEVADADDSDDDELFVDTYDLIHMPAKKQKMAIGKVVKDKNWLSEVSKRVKQREMQVELMNLKYFTFVEEILHEGEEQKTEQMELNRDGDFKLTSSSVKKFSYRKRTTKTSAEMSKATMSVNGKALDRSQLGNLLANHSMQMQKYFNDVPPSSQFASVNQSININISLRKDEVAGVLKDLQFDAEGFVSKLGATQKRLMSAPVMRLKALKAPAVNTKPIETVDLVDTDDGENENRNQSPKKIVKFSAPQQQKQLYDIDEAEPSSDEDFLGDPEAIRKIQERSIMARAANQTSNLTLPMANWKLDTSIAQSVADTSPTKASSSAAIKSPPKRKVPLFELPREEQVKIIKNVWFSEEESDVE